MAHRVFGQKTGRIHHFHSNHELGCFLLLEWNNEVVDIREQFPLFPVSETQTIAEELGYRYPIQRFKRNGKWRQKPAVLTSDFRVSLSDRASTPELIISVKPSAELRKRRVLEKLEIERSYWQHRSVEWQLVTEQELPQVMINNLKLILPFRDLGGSGLSKCNLEPLLAELYRYFEKSEHSLKATCSEFEKDVGLQVGTGLTLVWHALATKYWATNLSQPLDPSRRIELFWKRAAGVPPSKFISH
jgi:hypothetical protein